MSEYSKLELVSNASIRTAQCGEEGHFSNGTKLFTVLEMKHDAYVEQLVQTATRAGHLAGEQPQQEGEVVVAAAERVLSEHLV